MQHRRIIKQGPVTLATREDGSMDPTSASSQGLFLADTRFLSRFQIRLNDLEPVLLGSSEEISFESSYLHTNLEMGDIPARGIGILQLNTIDGSGYIQYQAHTPPKASSAALTVGLFNQGWKDSSIAVMYADGTMCMDHPVALAEVQGYLYRALYLWSDLYSLMPETEGMRPEGENLSIAGGHLGLRLVRQHNSVLMEIMDNPDELDIVIHPASRHRPVLAAAPAPDSAH